MTKAPLPELALFGMTVAWGLSFVVIPWALEDAGYLTLTCLRLAVGTAFLLALKPKALAATVLEWRAGVLGGLMLAIGYVLQTAGLTESGSGVAGFLTSFYVPLVPLFEAAVARRWPPGRDLGAVTLAVIGIAVLTLRGDFTLGLGETLIAVSALYWAAQIVLVGRVAERADPVRLAAVQLLTAFVVVTGLRLAFPEGERLVWTPRFVASLVFLGVVTNALGFLAQAWAQKRVAPTRTAILFSPEPVFAAVFGVWLKAEEFGGRQFAGSALVMAAVVLTVWAPKPAVAADAAAR
jgi:drug/metabolite transporter (DMT)-like permease